MKNLFVLLPACLLMLSGCDDIKDANEKNLKVAAQRFLDWQYPHCYLKVNFPYTPNGIYLNGEPGMLHVMAKKGLVKETEISRKHVSADGTGQEKDIINYSYDLTEEGRKYYKADAVKRFNGSLGGFCFGKANVESVVNFTEPSVSMGKKISWVVFTYKVKDIPEWAKDPEILKTDMQLKKDAGSDTAPIKWRNLFILTEKGWVHERLFGE